MKHKKAKNSKYFKVDGEYYQMKYLKKATQKNASHKGLGARLEEEKKGSKEEGSSNYRSMRARQQDKLQLWKADLDWE